MDIQKIRNLLNEGRINESLVILREMVEISYPNFRNDSIVISARFNQLRRDERNGLIDYKIIQIERNKLINSVLDLLEEIEDFQKPIVISKISNPIVNNSISSKYHLKEILDNHFNEEELRNLCFYLEDCDYENLSGEGKTNKIRELVGFLERRNRIGDLITIINSIRPDIDI